MWLCACALAVLACWIVASAPAAYANGESCPPVLPSPRGALTAPALSQISGCMGFLRTGLQQQLRDAQTNLATCHELSSSPDTPMTAMGDVGSAYVNDGESANPSIVDRIRTSVLTYLKGEITWYDAHPAAAQKGVVAATQLTVTAFGKALFLIGGYNSQLARVGSAFREAAGSRQCSGVDPEVSALADAVKSANGEIDVVLAGLAAIGSHLKH
jgi:hypothetical protein